MGVERTRQNQSVQSEQNQQEIERLRRENERLKEKRTEW
jgi:FtsZ-binding cell division protein ZapB